MTNRQIRSRCWVSDYWLRVVGTWLAIVLLPLAAQAEVRLPAIFSEHMVVQAGKSLPVWGWAEPGERVTVSLAGQSQTVQAGADGKWAVTLDALHPTAAAQTLVVAGTNRLSVGDVLVGEVWLCAGQSNMEMQIRGLHGQVDRAEAEIAAAKFPQIRMFVHHDVFSIDALACPPAEPLADRSGAWVVCSPETVARFSAIGYFFARTLHEQLNVPIGFINAAVGGTPIEAWTSREAQTVEPGLQGLLDDWQRRLTGFETGRAMQEFAEAKQRWLKERSAARAAGRPAPKAPARFRNLEVMAPGRLFNGVIAPWVPYAVRGVLWYQGERNAAGPFTGLYGLQLKTLINDWRGRWNEPLYFAWVQLPRFQKEQQQPSEPRGWGVAVRDEMRKTLNLPQTAMAITIDYGGVNDGHPTNKADFAARLSRLALRDVYGKPIALASGPLFRSAQRQGEKMVLALDQATGLKPASGALRGFAIAGDDRKFVWAKTQIDGDRVFAWADEVPRPTAVRYGWAANPDCNLVNAAGLPASPFRTDDWD